MPAPVAAPVTVGGRLAPDLPGAGRVLHGRNGEALAGAWAQVPAAYRGRPVYTDH